jgi:hypothetical protein
MDDLDKNNEWDEMIAWCPTQLSKRVYIGSIEFILYLRWRHTDPFTYSIYIDDDNKKHLEKLFNVGIFIDDLFEKYGRSYGVDGFDKDVIEKDAEKIWNQYEKPRILKIIEEHPEEII